MISNATWGWKQWSQTTPAFVGRFRKFLIYLLSGSAMLSPLIKQAGYDPVTILAWMGGAVFVLGGILSEFFGAKITTDTVPTSEVTEVETGKP